MKYFLNLSPSYDEEKHKIRTQNVTFVDGIKDMGKVLGNFGRLLSYFTGIHKLECLLLTNTRWSKRPIF